MKFIIFSVLALSITLLGCQKKEQTTSSAPAYEVPGERVEAAKRLILMSAQALQQGDPKKAVESLELAIQANPTEPASYMLLGQIMLNAKQYEQAVTFLDNAAKRFPDNANISYLYALSNYMIKEPLPAALAARRAAEIYARDGDKENAQKAAALLQQVITTTDVGQDQQPIVQQ